MFVQNGHGLTRFKTEFGIVHQEDIIENKYFNNQWNEDNHSEFISLNNLYKFKELRQSEKLDLSIDTKQHRNELLNTSW